MEDYTFKYEYPSLSMISQIFKVIGVTILIVAIIGFIYGLNLTIEEGNRKVMGIYLIISSLISGLIFPLIFFAFAELIKLFTRIEFNTRKEFKDDSNNKVDNSEFQPPEKTIKTFDEWKKENPSKSLNDYYAALLENK